MALQHHGTPRLMFDADIEVAFETAQQQGCLERGFTLEEEGRDVFGQRTRIHHPPTSAVYVELFLVEHAFPRRALDRRIRVRLDVLQRDAWLITREDLVVMKILHGTHAERPGWKAAQDKGDVEGIRQATGEELDVALIQGGCEALGIPGKVVRDWVRP